jgi:hypothetical protein
MEGRMRQIEQLIQPSVVVGIEDQA